MITSRAGL